MIDATSGWSRQTDLPCRPERAETSVPARCGSAVEAAGNPPAVDDFHKKEKTP
jgi:hypothetical protein